MSNTEITQLSLLPIFKDLDRIQNLNKVLMPIIRRVWPTIIANEIISVQPMTGPVGQIHTLRVKYADLPLPEVLSEMPPQEPEKIKKSWLQRLIDKIKEWLWK